MSKAQPLQALYLEDNPKDCELVARALDADGLHCEFTMVTTEVAFKTALAGGAFDIILSDFTIPGFSGTAALRLAKDAMPDTPFVFVSGTIGEERAVDGVKSGATDYVLKDHLTRLGPVVRRALREAQDRRERQRVKEQLQLFRSLIDRTNDAIEIIDPETGRFLDVNEQACLAHGYTRDEYLALTFPELVPGRPWSEIRETLRSHGSLLLEGEHRRRNDSFFPVEVRVTYIQHGPHSYILAIARDISERKKAEAALQASEERFRQIAENIEEVFWLTDLTKGMMLYVSPAYENVWGRSCQSLYDDPKSWLTAIHPEDRDRVSEAAHSRQENGNYNETYRIIRPNGEIRWINDRGFPILDGSGNAYRIAGVATDITEKKELEAQVLRSQRMDSIGALAGGIAHDLNNMLAPILMAIDLLRMDLQDPGQLRMIETASASAQRGADLVKQILQFSRGAAKRGIVNLRAVEEDINRFVSKVFPPTIIVKSEVDRDLWPVAGDATQLHQVFLNLCVNARDAMNEAGRLLVTLKNRRFANYSVTGSDQSISGAFVELMVSDTGPGIPPEIRDRIFEPFFTTKPQGKGTGLGLSTVATIISNHKGFVEVASTPGKGATFRVFLPAAAKTGAGSDPLTRSAGSLGRGEWILLVDDEQALLEMTKEFLEANNYNVLTATNGIDALRAFENHREKLAVVIADMLMPELGGKELIATISERLPDILTICLSGSIEETTLMRKEQSSATAFLRKPCPTSTLLNVLAKMLASRRSSHSSPNS